MTEFYEAILQTTYVGQKCVNRWNFVAAEIPSTISGALGLATAMGAIYDPDAETYPTDKLIYQISTLMVTAVTFNFLNVRNVYSDDDFLEVPFVQTLTGQQALAGEPPFNAMGFRSTRTKQSIHRGSKRFVGAPDSLVENGGGINSALLADMQQVADIMNAALVATVSGEDYLYKIVIAQQEEYDVPNTNPVRKARRYYQDPTTQLAHCATGVVWSPYTQIRSQTSRQYGKGQ